MKILTIVIPSYNTEKFIDKNITSFINERLFKDVEIIIVNDGSIDSTEKRAVEYQNRYPGYIRVISKENGGHGSTINIGIENASGKYFKVVDGDDWVDTDNLIEFVKFLKETNVDLVINSHYKISEKTGKRKLIPCTTRLQTGKLYKVEDVVVELVKGLRLAFITYKTEILQTNHIKVAEKCYYDDVQYDLYPIPYIENVIFLNLPVYYYLVDQQGQSVSNSSVLKNKDMLLKVYEGCVKYIDSVENEISSPKRILMTERLYELGRSIYNIFLRNFREPGIYNQMILYDARVKAISKKHYDEIGKKNKYIFVIRHGKKMLFHLIGCFFKIYRKIKLSI